MGATTSCQFWAGHRSTGQLQTWLGLGVFGMSSSTLPSLICMRSAGGGNMPTLCDCFPIESGVQTIGIIFTRKHSKDAFSRLEIEFFALIFGLSPARKMRKIKMSCKNSSLNYEQILSCKSAIAYVGPTRFDTAPSVSWFLWESTTILFHYFLSEEDRVRSCFTLSPSPKRKHLPAPMQDHRLQLGAVSSALHSNYLCGIVWTMFSCCQSLQLVSVSANGNSIRWNTGNM